MGSIPYLDQLSAPLESAALAYFGHLSWEDVDEIRLYSKGPPSLLISAFMVPASVLWARAFAYRAYWTISPPRSHKTEFDPMLVINGERGAVGMSLADFFAANNLGIGAKEQTKIVAALKVTGRYDGANVDGADWLVQTIGTTCRITIGEAPEKS